LLARRRKFNEYREDNWTVTSREAWGRDFRDCWHRVLGDVDALRGKRHEQRRRFVERIRQRRQQWRKFWRLQRRQHERGR
jgi:hypothetical protein